MIERKLNENHDIFFENGNSVYVSGVDQIVQNIGVRLKFFAEYFLDVTIGVPYYEQVLRKNVNLDQIESRIKLEILNTDGVNSIDSFFVEFNRSKRSLKITYTATTIHGSTGEVILNV